MIDLKKILDKHPEAAEEMQTMIGLLHDHYPDYEDEYEISNILNFMETGIVEDLKKKKQNDQIITAADEKKYLTKIKKRYGVQEGISGPIFRLWTDALGLEVEKGEETGPDDAGNSGKIPPDEPAGPLKQKIRPGDTLTFGRYEQDNDPGNGPEPIEWQVLAVEKDRALLISRYGLDVKPYNEKQADITWETCTLRSWLNGEFYEKAFGVEEKVWIRKTANQNPDNPDHGTVGGEETEDRIFLLSIDEAREYFGDYEARQCRCTGYAGKNGAYAGPYNNTRWWLRTPGFNSLLETVVGSDGDIYTSGFSISAASVAVRPAFWLDLDEDPGGGKKLVTVEAAVVWDDDNDRDGKRPDKVTLSLLSEGKKIQSLETGAESGWKQTVSGLPKYSGGKVINYTWTEDSLPEGYSLRGYSVTGTETTLTNSHTPEMTEAAVKVIWDDGNDRDGIRPESLIVILSKTGKAVTLSEQNGWTETVSGLPKYSDGKEIEYTWQEGAVPGGYTLSGNVREGTETTLTNSHTSKPAAKPAPRRAIRVGDVLMFGRYKQANEPGKGPAPIEWQVLAVEYRRALLISKYGLDVKPYNDTRTDVTWETCTLRSWLNWSFYSSAFGPEEKNRIKEVMNKNPDNSGHGTKGGKNTKDRIFLLSIDEANKYFKDDEARMCLSTAYAMAKRNFLRRLFNLSDWWLRSPGNSGNTAANVNNFGDIYNYGSFVDDSGIVVRPAFWLNLDDGQEKSAFTPIQMPVPVVQPDPSLPEEKVPGGKSKPEANVGDTLTFGRYEQADEPGKGPEPIEWQVLAVVNGRALLISKYGLDAKPYNEKNTDVPWEHCSLRKWLNGLFYENAFSSDEKGRIRNVMNKNSCSRNMPITVNDTEDRIFLLSIDDMKKYFPNDRSRICRATAFAMKNGGWVSCNGNSFWWLRSLASSDKTASYVDVDGRVGKCGLAVFDKSILVRPAFWLDL